MRLINFLILTFIFSIYVFASLPPTQLKGGNEPALTTTFNFNLGQIPVTRTGTSVTFGTIPVTQGGTGLTSLTQYALLSGSGTAVNFISPAASGSILFSNGASDFPSYRFLTNPDVVTALGYTPADDAVSGTYLRKANNLSDLTSSSTARTNLGLGDFATASTIDLGSASATGIIADARLADQAGVVSGTQYTKVTVDGKGRVVSGAQLNNSDINTALGYTPVASVSSTAPITITGGASNPVVGHADSGVTSGTYTKVAVNSKGHVTSGTTLSESDIPNLDASKITTGILPSDRGGTSFGTYATGDLLVGSGTTLGKLPIGTSNQVLTVSGGAIVWSTNTAATVLNSVLTTTVSTTLTLSNDMVFVTPGTTTVTITLPSATSGTGKIITVQKTDIGPGSVMITTQGGQTIDGSSSTRLDVKLESAKLISDGLNWSVLNREFLIPITSKYRVSAVKTSSTTQPLDYDTVIFDDLSLVVPGASWNFKAPKAGIYQTCVTFVDPSVGTYMSIYVNGTLVQPLSTVVAASEPSANCNYVKVNKNDLIDARSATTMTLNSTGLGTFNNITITYYR